MGIMGQTQVSTQEIISVKIVRNLGTRPRKCSPALFQAGKFQRISVYVAQDYYRFLEAHVLRAGPCARIDQVYISGKQFLTTDHEVSGSIPGSTMGIYP
jgi:hypothetical protein